MKKYWKWILALVATGVAAGLIIAHFIKKNIEDDDLDEFTDDDFDLDVDLQPVSEREYVSLKKAAPETEEPTAETEGPTAETEEPAAEADETETTEE